jgi:xanthine dehydrogenase YagT iron-sulfur-binding subunit
MDQERKDPIPEEGDVSRRAFLKGAGLTMAAVGVAGPTAATAQSAGSRSGVRIVGPGKVELSLRINGEARKVAVEPSTTLLDLVRNELDLTGAKRVCDRGSCGACTMLVDGQTTCSCTMLAIDAEGKKITTIEGISAGGLTPLQEAFVECDALQCGFCTPGMVVACTALLAENPKPTRREVAEGIAGNLCRCGTYQNIFEAVEKGGRRARF